MLAAKLARVILSLTSSFERNAQYLNNINFFSILSAKYSNYISLDLFEKKKQLKENHETNSRFYYQPFNTKNSFKWLADKVGIDLKEVKLNFNYFRKNVKNMPFAIIQLNNEAIQDSVSIEKLGESLAFLHQNEMKIVIVLGQNMQKKMDWDSLKAFKTTNEMLIINLIEQFSKFNLKIMPIFNGTPIFKCQTNHDEQFSGTIVDVDSNLLKNCLMSDQIPIISTFGESLNSNKYLYLEINHVTHHLALKLSPFKIINLNSIGGLRDENNKLILNHAGVCLDKIKSLLTSLPDHTSYVITNINDMIAELFTNIGRGTYFKISESVIRINNLNELDLHKMKFIIENSFEKKLKPDFFEKLAKRNPIVFITESYSALAIITRDFDKYAYLDKFCVATQHQGHGLADSLWDEIKKDFNGLFWRSRATNPINSWYFRRAQGSWHSNNWILFWYGIHNPQVSSELINYAIELEGSFIEKNSNDAQKEVLNLVN